MPTGLAQALGQREVFPARAELLRATASAAQVDQSAVVHHGWLTPAQMIDGLPLVDTTPGPSNMVVTFVAFVGAWQRTELATLFGPNRRFLAAAPAATLEQLVYLSAVLRVHPGWRPAGQGHARQAGLHRTAHRLHCGGGQGGGEPGALLRLIRAAAAGLARRLRHRIGHDRGGRGAGCDALPARWNRGHRRLRRGRAGLATAASAALSALPFMPLRTLQGGLPVSGGQPSQTAPRVLQQVLTAPRGWAVVARTPWWLIV